MIFALNCSQIGSDAISLSFYHFKQNESTIAHLFTVNTLTVNSKIITTQQVFWINTNKLKFHIVRILPNQFSRSIDVVNLLLSLIM